MTLRTRFVTPSLFLATVLLTTACNPGSGTGAGGGDGRPAAASIPEDVIVLNGLGAAALGQQEVEKAIKMFGDALAKHANDPLLLSNLALAEMQRGSFDDAERHLREAVVADDGFLPAHFRLGVVLKQRGEMAEAIDQFQKVEASDPYDLVTHYHLGSLFVRKGDNDAGVAEFQKALELDPTHVSALYGLGRALITNGEGEKGQEFLAKSQKIREETGLGETVGLQYGEQGKYSIATEYPAKDLPAPAAIDVKFEAAATALPADHAASSPIFLDANGDDRPDLLLVESGALSLLLGGDGGGGNDGTFQPADLPSGPPAGVGAGAIHAYPGDLNNDGTMDIFVANGDAGPRVLQGVGGGKFQDVTAKSGLAKAMGAGRALISDFDHDGDLDVVLAPAVKAHPMVVFEVNSGNGTFKERNDAELQEGMNAELALIASDIDNDRDVDMAVAMLPGESSGVMILGNRRDGTYDQLGSTLGPPADLPKLTELELSDINKDGYMDMVVSGTGPGGPARVLLSRSAHKLDDDKGFSGALAAGKGGDGLALAVTDFDNDGFQDVAILVKTDSGLGVRLVRNLGAGKWEDATEKTGVGALPVPAGAFGIATADIDGDGDLDLAAGNAIFVNQGGGKARWASIGLTGLGDNRFGAGTKMEFRAGALWQKFEAPATGLPAHMGIGTHEKIDSLRMLWMGGVLQDEIEVPVGKIARIAQLDRKGTSCPILYAWDGSAIRFVTDFLGGSAIGYLEAENRWSIPDTNEYVKLSGTQLVPKDGVYDLRLVNQLEETIYFDRAQLLVVDHPKSVDVFPDEKLMPGPPYPEFRLFTTANARPPVSADAIEAGQPDRDVLDRVTEFDRRSVDGFTLLPFKGYAAPHALEIGLGDLSGSGQVVLLLDGWIDYADSTSNLAASQAGSSGQAGPPLDPPALDARRPGGTWRTVLPSIGFPAGLPKTMTVDLTGLLSSGETEIRIRTSMRIYWDRVRVATAGRGAETRITRLEPATANLSFLGFPKEVSPDGKKPKMYDYSQIAVTAPWKAHAGAYTRFGDVRELLASIDDQYVTTRNGDQIALRFDAASVPALPDGWTRDYLLFTDGFGKDMDPNSARPDTVGPMPYHAMPSFPYSANVTDANASDANAGDANAGDANAGERTGPARFAWLDRWNTRIVPADELGIPGATAPELAARK